MVVVYAADEIKPILPRGIQVVADRNKRRVDVICEDPVYP
jgi:hypothetical protein